MIYWQIHFMIYSFLLSHSYDLAVISILIFLYCDLSGWSKLGNSHKGCVVKFFHINNLYILAHKLILSYIKPPHPPSSKTITLDTRIL